MDNPLNHSSLAFPFLQSFHLLGIICGLGSAAVMNFSLLGVGSAWITPAKLWRDTLLWSLGGLTVAIFSGFLLFSIDPEIYLQKPVFFWKLEVLAAAILFYFTVVRWAARRDRKSFWVAGLSLLLFAIVPLCGVMLGYE